MFAGGVHPPGHKESTAGSPVQWAPVPARLVVPLSQHLGAPCAPLVGKGDRVERGQVIGDVDAMVSAPIHSPVSGTVSEVGTTLTAGGQRVAAVIIEPDESQDLAAFVPVAASGDPRARVRAAGIVGMGGATFPSTVKLTPPKGMDIQTVILNGCECEPYLTTDYRVMVEQADKIIAGIRIALRATGAPQAVIAVENNKPAAIEAMMRAVPAGAPISVCSLATKYPQGAEKMLSKAILDREVPSGGLPSDAGMA